MSVDAPVAAPAPPGNERWGGKTWTLVAALMVAFVIGGCGVWLWSQRDQDEPGPSTTAAPTIPSGTLSPGVASTVPVPVGPPDGFVGGRDLVDGVPAGFSHDENGAISAAATWVSYLFVCPVNQRPPGLANIVAAGSPALDPCATISTDLAPLKGMSAVAARGSVPGDAGTVELLVAGSDDFDAQRWSAAFEIVTVSVVWDVAAADWRLSTWSRRSFADGPEPTPDTFAGFRWLRPLGFARTSTPFALGFGAAPAVDGGTTSAGFVGGSVNGDVPTVFPHSGDGAVSAAATWVSYFLVCPSSLRAATATEVLGPGAPSPDPCNPGDPNDPRHTGRTALAVRGQVAGDNVVIELLTATSDDFNATWEAGMEVVTVTLSWDPARSDWQVANWSVIDLFDNTAPPITPATFQGFMWVRPIGFAVTGDAFVKGDGE